MIRTDRQALADLLTIVRALEACEAELSDAVADSDEEAFLLEQHDDLMADLFERADAHDARALQAPRAGPLAMSA